MDKYQIKNKNEKIQKSSKAKKFKKDNLLMCKYPKRSQYYFKNIIQKVKFFHLIMVVKKIAKELPKEEIVESLQIERIELQTAQFL